MAESELLRKALVLLSRRDRGLGDDLHGLQHLPVTTQEVDFARLGSSLPILHKLTRERGLDFVLFAENDQVLSRGDVGPTIRALRAGYSSFSGIDEPMYAAQTRQCLKDLVAGQASLDLPSSVHLESAWPKEEPGFCLIFDTEQLGGVRFGLPRILTLLDAYRVPATFFVTGFVASVYPDLVPALTARGHSVGVHGEYHEYLSDLDLPTQVERLESQKSLLAPHAPVGGANLIFRMNHNTVEALVASGYQYFVVSMEYTFAPSGYRRMPTRPFLVRTSGGSIWMVPVSIETYNRPVMATKLALDSAIDQARQQHAPAVTVLMHPFRDGALRHVGALESLIRHLKARRRLVPTTLDRIIECSYRSEPSAYVYVNLADGDMQGYTCQSPNGRLGRLWHSRPRYWQRVQVLYRGLEQLGYAPALCLSRPDNVPTFAVYPHVPDERSGVVSIRMDPLTCSPAGSGLLPVLERYVSCEANTTVVFGPGSQSSSFGALIACSTPQSREDWLGLVPELGIRLLSRLTRLRQTLLTNGRSPR